MSIYPLVLSQLLFSLIGAISPSPDYSPSSYPHSSDNGLCDSSNGIGLGTALVAIRYSKGVVVACDTRTSVGGYVSNKFSHKINSIFNESDTSSSSTIRSSSCVVCRSGSAADTQLLVRAAKRQFRIRSLERPYFKPNIFEVAHFLRYIFRDVHKRIRSSSPLQASLICAGYNAATNAGQIYGISPGGSVWQDDRFCVSGSGSTVMMGYLDMLFLDDANNNDLTEEETIDLVTKLLRTGIARDGNSGGLIRLYVINKSGIREKTIYLYSSKSLSSPSSTDAASTNENELKGFAKRKQ